MKDGELRHESGSASIMWRVVNSAQCLQCPVLSYMDTTRAPAPEPPKALHTPDPDSAEPKGCNGNMYTSLQVT